MSDPQISSTIDILSRLVGFDTESSKSNLALIDYVAGYLDRHEIPYLRLPNSDGDKAALFATIGPNVAGGVVLSGHTDVVPVEGQDWTTPAFELREAEGKLYGRGACDMKGFAACALALAPELKKLALKRPIHIMLSYDEETTCLGVVDAIAKFGNDIPQPAAVIVGEPSEMRVVDAHKGVACFDTFVTGFEVHSSKPQLGVNAVALAAKLVVFLDELQQEFIARGDETGRFDPPYTTIHVGNIKGGTARNITAKDCHFEWEFRAVPGVDDTEIPGRMQKYAEEVLLLPMRKIAPTANVRTVMKINVPGLAPDPGNAAEVLAFRLTGANHTETVPYGTEAGMFQRGGVPVVVCGPGNINQAHQPDEWIAISELEKCLGFMRRLAADLAG